MEKKNLLLEAGVLKENPPAGFWAKRLPPRPRVVVALVVVAAAAATAAAAAAAAGVPRAVPKEKPPELVTGAL